MIIGSLAAIGTGVLQPLNTLLFGTLTGSIVDYVSVLLANDTTPEKLEEATNNFINGIDDFAIYNTLIGIGMLVLSYISTETFNYTALKQVINLFNTKVLAQILKPL